MHAIKRFSLLCLCVLAVAGASAQTITEAKVGDAEISVTPAWPKNGFTATLTPYTCANGVGVPIGPTVAVTPGKSPTKVALTDALEAGDVVCVVEVYSVTLGPLPVPAAPEPTTSAPVTVAPPAAGAARVAHGPQFDLSAYRLMLGVDVSAAASTDPAAKFLLEFAGERPITTRATASPQSFFWASGYVRLASIAQPGAISGASDVATYIKPLLDSTPNKVVQSAEVAFALEARILHHAEGTKTPYLHFIAESGLITPLSVSQANPTIYQVNEPLFDYYKGAASSDPVANSAFKALKTACGVSTFSTTAPVTTCSVIFTPPDRSRFYRNWSVGFRLKNYEPSGDKKTYTFPETMTLSVGQNEYVTGGKMHGFVLHAGGSFTIPSKVAPKLAGVLYGYGAVDLALTRANPGSQQFLLQTANSTVSLTDPSVANIQVADQNRDRYRFGVGLDLSKLVSLMTAK